MESQDAVSLAVRGTLHTSVSYQKSEETRGICLGTGCFTGHRGLQLHPFCCDGQDSVQEKVQQERRVDGVEASLHAKTMYVIHRNLSPLL